MHNLGRLLVGTLLVCLASACGGGGGSNGGSGGGGAAAKDEDISKAVIAYFQKAANTPGLTLGMKKMEAAEMPGWRKGTLEAKLGEQSQDVLFYVSQDGKYLFRGEAIDLSVDPNVAVMSKVDLKNQPARGPADAKVTVVEYSDFQCPFCARVWETLEKEVLSQYGDKVRFVFKQMPLNQIHPWAEEAAIATECAYVQGNDQFWIVYNGLFAKQSEITEENLPAKLEEMAAGSNIDVPKLKECLAAKQTLDAVKADMAEAAEVGVSSTPTFIINGRRLSGAQTAESFKQAIDDALKASAAS